MIEILLASIFIINTVILILLIFSSKKNQNKTLENKFDSSLNNFEKRIFDEFSRIKSLNDNSYKNLRDELSNSLKSVSDSLFKQLSEGSQVQNKELKNLAETLNSLIRSMENRIETLKEKVEDKLKDIQTNNSQKLDEMRVIVDEKLHSTLEKRLGESFKIVSERLELVHKGLGEMQNLASGVGDLKKVLTNIKTRGTWGEIQLGNLIEQILTKEQFAKNVKPKRNSNEIVEYAIKMPGKLDDADSLWLPIDSKFPLEDYQRLCDAQECADTALIDDAIKALVNRIKNEAKSIHDKYLDPPYTTDFAILFLPIEGLYAEVLRVNGLSDFIQREYRIVIAGPTTLTAILNSLQMGFRTLAIEKRSSEVWELLSAVKTDFRKFGEVLEKTKKKLQEASNTIEKASTASRKIERRLKKVQELPQSESKILIEEDLKIDDESEINENLEIE